jgi:hypothetical protein
MALREVVASVVGGALAIGRGVTVVLSRSPHHTVVELARPEPSLPPRAPPPATIVPALVRRTVF